MIEVECGLRDALFSELARRIVQRARMTSQNQGQPVMQQLEFRLAVVMAERKIRTVTELTRRLKEQGLEVSSSHMTRFMRDNPPSLTLPFLTALCNALACQPSDLFQWIAVPGGVTSSAAANPQAAKETPPPKGQGEGSVASLDKKREESVAGPRIGSMPRPKRD